MDGYLIIFLICAGIGLAMIVTGIVRRRRLEPGTDYYEAEKQKANNLIKGGILVIFLGGFKYILKADNHLTY